MPTAHEAITLTELGFAVFPLEPRGKKPVTRNGFKNATHDTATITHWWADHPNANIGVATGPISGVLVIDIDGAAAEHAWQNLANPEDNDTLEVRTGRGRHLYYQCTDPLPNTASRIAPGIDTRGHGGYVVAPPSIHPDGATYEWAAARRPRPLPQWIREAITPPTPTNGAGDPARILNHPATHAYAAATLHNLFGAVASAPEGQRNDALNKAAFAAGRLIAGGVLNEHDAEITLHAAASAAGLTTTETHATLHSGVTAGQQHPWTPDLRAPTTTQTLPPRTDDHAGDEETEAEGTGNSWQPIDIIAAANTPPPSPNLYGGLIYPNARHLISGEPETMKSWLALAVAHHVATDNGAVLYINTDGAPNWDIAQRLRAIGLTDQHITRNITLITPTDTPTPQDIDQLVKQAPDVVILDTLDPAAELIGADTTNSKDTMRTLRTYITPFFQTGASILILDHVVKDPESRGRYSSGSGRKLGEVEVHIGLKLVGPPLTREGGNTRIHVTIHKDRLAGIRRGGHGSFGHIEWAANHGGTTITATVHPNDYTDTDTDQYRLTRLMQKVSEVLELDGDLSTNQIINSVDARKESIRTAIAQLKEDGHIEGTPGPNRSVRYHSITPFREAE